MFIPCLPKENLLQGKWERVCHPPCLDLGLAQAWHTWLGVKILMDSSPPSDTCLAPLGSWWIFPEWRVIFLEREGRDPSVPHAFQPPFAVCHTAASISRPPPPPCSCSFSSRWNETDTFPVRAVSVKSLIMLQPLGPGQRKQREVPQPDLKHERPREDPGSRPGAGLRVPGPRAVSD